MRSDLFSPARLAAIAIVCAAPVPLLALPTASPPLQQSDAKIDVRTLPASGPVRQCINFRDMQSTRPVGKDVLMVRVGQNRWLRNDLRSNCAGLREDRALVFRASTGFLCSMDTFDMMDPVDRFSTGFCSLGAFTPVDIPKGARF